MFILEKLIRCIRLQKSSCLRHLLICSLMRRRLLCAFLLGLFKINGMSYAGACCLVVIVTIAIVIGVSWIVQNKIYKYLCKFVNRIVEVLDILRCPEDINIKDMNDEDWRNLNRLIVAFLDGKPVKGLKEDLPPLVFLKVGKLRFAVCLQQCEEEGSYIFYDFFKKELPVAFEDQGKMFPISQYAILQKKELLTVSNIDFDRLLPSFQNVTHHCETYDRANCFFLEMLNACDEAQGERKKLLLKTCIEFSEWLLKAPEDELDRQVKLLNMLQTIKRDRDFNPDERDALYEMIENNKEREDCLVGAYLLLGQQKAAERHFARLSEEEQQIFKEYPIYYFWDGGKINGQNENADSQ